MSDFRFVFDGDFDTTYVHEDGDTFQFVIRAVKPSRKRFAGQGGRTPVRPPRRRGSSPARAACRGSGAAPAGKGETEAEAEAAAA